jgi:hypothetical protein
MDWLSQHETAAWQHINTVCTCVRLFRVFWGSCHTFSTANATTNKNPENTTGSLGDDGQPRAQLLQGDRRCVDAVDGDGTLVQLKHAICGRIVFLLPSLLACCQPGNGTCALLLTAALAQSEGLSAYACAQLCDLSLSNKGAGLQQVHKTSSRGIPCSYGPTALVLQEEWVSCAADQGTASPVKCVHLLPPSVHPMTHMAA